MRISSAAKRRKSFRARAAVPLIVTAISGCSSGETATEEGLLAAGNAWIDAYYDRAADKEDVEDLYQLFTDECQEAFPEHEFMAVYYFESVQEGAITNVAVLVNGDSGIFSYDKASPYADIVDVPPTAEVMPWVFVDGEWRNADCILSDD